MKLILFFALLFSISTSGMAQVSKFESTDTTGKLPKGLYISKGKIKIKNGYTIKPSVNGKIMMLVGGGGLGVTGAYSCYCESAGGGSCSAEISGTTITCKGRCGLLGSCKLVVTTESLTDLSMEINPDYNPTPKTGWKIFVLPKKN